MLFLTGYRIDSGRFEPRIEEFESVRIDCNALQTSLRIFYFPEYSESDDPNAFEDAYIYIETYYAPPEIPPSVEEFLCSYFNATNRRSDIPRPENYGECISEIHSHLDNTATRQFNLLRWRIGVTGGPLQLSSYVQSMRCNHKLGWSALTNGDSVLCNPLPFYFFDAPSLDSQAFDYANSSRSVINEWIQSAESQPLYHDLFREAWQNQQSNPRSSLVMAIAAAETGVKTAAANLSPASLWIFENLQSPPLDKMLREYLTQLPVRCKFNGEVRRPPKAMITQIKKGVEIRNMLVHGRKVSVDAAELFGILQAVHDLLYLLDYYSGHEWALERISPEALSQLMAEGESKPESR